MRFLRIVVGATVAAIAAAMYWAVRDIEQAIREAFHDETFAG